MFDRLFTLFLQLYGKAAGDLDYALHLADNELKDADSIIFNYIGENTTHKEGIYRAATNYYSILNSIKNGGKREISIKSSQFNYSKVILERLTREVCIKNSILWIDAEKYDQAKQQLRLALGLSSYLNSNLSPYAVGLCLQLKSYDCERHAKKCFENNIRVRLCMGAYSSPYKNTTSVLLDRAKRIVELHKRCGSHLLEIATIQNMGLVILALENELPIQILYGYHKKLINYPFKVKVYLPFGTNWGPYIMRRIKEKINGS